MEKRELNYTCEGTRLCGAVVAPSDASLTNTKPGVLVAHDWRGRTPFQLSNAERIAELGYVALALDMYGDGRTGNGALECAALMRPLQEDRALLMKRINAAF